MKRATNTHEGLCVRVMCDAPGCTATAGYEPGEHEARGWALDTERGDLCPDCAKQRKPTNDDQSPAR